MSRPFRTAPMKDGIRFDARGEPIEAEQERPLDDVRKRVEAEFDAAGVHHGSLRDAVLAALAKPLIHDEPVEET